MFLIWLCLVNARLAISLAAAFFPRRKKTGSQKFNKDDAQRQRRKAIFGKGKDARTVYKEKNVRGGSSFSFGSGNGGGGQREVRNIRGL